jgi:oligoendopeptidase F
MESLAPSSAAGMNHLFESGNMVFITDKNAQDGAFTGYLYEHETPICYFGPGYQSVFTVVHELGHYYAFVDNSDSSLPLDFSELQSQGNEFMYMAFMESQNDNRVWRVVKANQMYSSLVSIIICCMVDEFEQYVYTHADEITDPTTDLDKIMDRISKTYGNGMFNNFVDINNYWRMVVVESPVYYISYAVSGVMALDLYSIAKTDYAAAVEQYRALVEEVTGDDTLQSFLEIAGLGSPFDEETYKRIAGV